VHQTAADQVAPEAETGTDVIGPGAYRAPHLTWLGTLADLTDSDPGTDVGFTISDALNDGLVTGY
jgi:hypothetical protein